MTRGVLMVCDACGADARRVMSGYLLDCECAQGKITGKVVSRSVFFSARLPRAHRPEQFWSIDGLDGSYQFVRTATPATSVVREDEVVALVGEGRAGLFRRVAKRRKPE